MPYAPSIALAPQLGLVLLVVSTKDTQIPFTQAKNSHFRFTLLTLHTCANFRHDLQSGKIVRIFQEASLLANQWPEALSHSLEPAGGLPKACLQPSTTLLIFAEI